MAKLTPSSVAAFADTAPEFNATLTAADRPWRQDRALVAAALTLALIIVAALAAPWIVPYDPTHQVALTQLQLKPPSSAHWFGTDPFSRDVFSRVVYGTRISLTIAFVSVALSLAVGTSVGAIAGFVGGFIDDLLMRIVDALLAIPRVLLILAFVSLWGTLPGWQLALLIGCTGWLGVARLVRAQVLELRDREFVIASRGLGSSQRSIIVRHVLPHLASPILVAATLGIGNVIVVEAGLSFLGIGIPQPQPSWGNIIRDGYDFVHTAWWLTVFPGLALIVTVLAANVLSDRLRRAIDPRQLPAR